jgi:hypothetical protein
MDRHPEGDPRTVKNVTITENLILSGGRIHPAGIGVLILNAHDCLVSHNTIRDLYYTGISVGWVWGAGFSPSQRNKILSNRIDQIGQDVLSDMAGIYTLGESPGTVIRGNVISNVRKARYGGWGIYFDEGSRWILVENNVAAYTEDSPFHIHYGGDNIVKNNLFAYGENAQMQFSNNSKIGPMLIEGNTFLWKSGKLFQSEPGEQVTFRKNTYWREEAPTEIQWVGGKLLPDWRSREPDALVKRPAMPNQRQLDFGPSFPRLLAKTPSQRLRQLPSSLQTFLPAPEPEIPAYADDFELAALGLPPSGLSHLFANESARASVTDEVAKSGKRSLKVVDGEGGEPWMPHLFFETDMRSGPLATEFWILQRANSHIVFEWRDTQPWYTTGPAVEINSLGQILVSGKQVGQVPLGNWFKVTVETSVGQQQWTLTVTPSAGNPLVSKHQVPSGFKKLTWVGFVSLGKPGSVFYLDDLKLPMR